MFWVPKNWLHYSFSDLLNKHSLNPFYRPDSKCETWFKMWFKNEGRHSSLKELLTTPFPASFWNNYNILYAIIPTTWISYGNAGDRVIHDIWGIREGFKRHFQVKFLIGSREPKEYFRHTIEMRNHWELGVWFLLDSSCT